MDTHDIRNLQEAYLEVYDLDEAEVLAQKSGSPGTVQVKKTREGGFFGIGGREVNKPVPGTFKPKDVPSRDAARYNTGIDRKFGVDPSDTHSTAASSVQHRARSAGDSGYMKVKDPSSIPDTGRPNRPTPARSADQNYARRAGSDIVRMNRLAREQVDIYDIILTHLLDEGYAETPEHAQVIMGNMSEEWRENIVEAEVLSKLGGVEGTGVGKDFKKRSWTDTEKSRYSSAKSSGNSSKTSDSAPAKSQTTKSDDDFDTRAMRSGKSPVEYQKKLDQDADIKANAARDAEDTASNRQALYQKSKDDAEELGSWYKYNPNDPTDKAEIKKLAMTNYNKQLAIRQNKKDYDPSKYDTDDFKPRERSGQQAWDKL